MQLVDQCIFSLEPSTSRAGKGFGLVRTAPLKIITWIYLESDSFMQTPGPFCNQLGEVFPDATCASFKAENFFPDFWSMRILEITRIVYLFMFYSLSLKHTDVASPARMTITRELHHNYVNEYGFYSPTSFSSTRFVWQFLES